MIGREKSLFVVFLFCLFVLTLYLTRITFAQDVTNDEQIIERYKLMLVRKPKEGSTFDRVYQFYLENAGLEALVSDYQAESQATPDDANVQLILGHIYKRLGKDTEALTIYQRAVELAPNKYYPHVALGQMYATLRQHEEAIQELNKAASLSEQAQNVPPEELTAIYKALGNAYFSRDKVDEAIQAWKKISELDPDDIFARIELADLFREQELFEQAIAQHEAIIQLKKDEPYRVCLSRREIGNIHEAKGDFEKAIQHYDEALTLTAPGNWLRKDLQHRIIGIFAADSNWEGLIEYYQAKLETTPNEPELIGQLAAAYIENQQLEEGMKTYRQGLALAPTDAALRLNLIASLRNAEKYEDAAAEYEVLSEQDPDDFGIYRELGELYLQIGNQAKAKSVYQKMIDRDPNNPSTHLILAEIYAGHEWIEDGIEQYEKAITLAPKNLDFIEYFGDFYFRQGDREKALETWNRMVAGELNTAENNNQLAELLNAKKFKAEAVAATRKAVELMPDEYRYREALAKQLMENNEYEDALQEFTKAMELAPNAFFAEKMDDKRIELFRRQGTLLEKIEELETELEKTGLAEADVFTYHRQLAKMYLRLGNVTYALEVLLKAKEQEPHDIGVNRWLAEVYHRQGRRDDSNAVYMHLIELDSANAREYHANIAKSYLNVLDFEAAATAAKQVIAHSPRNPEGHQLLAQVAKQSGEYETAIDSLKQAVRLRPEAIDIRRELAAIYKLSGKLQQSLSQYWRCWELSHNINEKLTFVKPLSEVYYDLGRRGEFEERLKQMAKSNTVGVGPVLALTELYRLEGDLPSARFQLAQALNKQREDPELLTHLVQISMELGDLQDALSYQQRLVKVDPDYAHQRQLGELLFDAGREQEAIQAWTKLLHAKNQTLEAEVKLAALLLRHGRSEEAFIVLDRASEKISGTDAHLPLYRLGTMLVSMNEPERAQTYFHRILEMSEPIGNTSNKKSAQPSIFYSSSVPGIERNKFRILRSSVGTIQSRPNFAGASMPWTPKDFEEAQSGALVQLTTIAQSQGKLPELIKHFEDNAEVNPTDVKSIEILVKLYTLVQFDDKAKEAIDRLVEISPNDSAYQPLKLHRIMEENPDYETLKKSLKEMPGMDNVSQLAYIAEYAQMLYHKDKKEDAAKLLSEIENVNVTDINTGFELIDAFHLIDKVDIAERLLTNLPVPPQKQQYQYMRKFESLTDDYIKKDELEKATALFWTYCERTKPTKINPRRVAALAQTSYYYGGYRPIQTSYPAPTAYFNSDRLGYLQSIFRDFWMRDQQQLLFTKFQTEFETTEGRNKIFPALALSYCYWWDENGDEAQQVLTVLQQEFPDDLTLKLNTALASIQTGEHKVATELLENLVATEPRNRKQYQDLLLQLFIRTGDTVAIRELMSKMLSSPIGGTELYQFSQILQDAGFTQYAIAAAKKAMTLAMVQRNPNFLIQLGQHLGNLGRGQDASLLAERALRFANRPDRYGRMMYSWNFQQATKLVNQSKSIKEREDKFITDVEKNPESFQAQLRLAMYYEGTNKISKAAETFKAALKLQPKDDMVRLRYVQMMERNGKANDVIPEYLTLLKNDSSALGYNYKTAVDAFVAAEKFDALISLVKDMIDPVGKYAGSDLTASVGRRCLKEEKVDDAIEIFKKIIKVHPSWYYIHQDLANAYIAAGDVEKAVQYLTDMHELEKTSLTQSQFVLKIAEYYEEAGEREKAIQYIREQLSSDDSSDSDTSYVLKLAELYKEDEKLDSFIAEYDAKLAEFPEDTKLLYLTANLKLSAEDTEGASNHVDQLIDTSLGTVQTNWLYSLAQASDDAGSHKLQFHILEAIAEKLERENSWKLEECYKKLGEAYAKRDELEKAQNAFRKMGTLQIMKDNQTSIYEKRNLGSTYMQHKMWDDAEAIFTEIINDLKASSYDREYSQERVMRIKQQRGEFNTAEQITENLQDMSVGMRRAMAKELMQRNQIDKAIEVYEKIEKEMPEDFESRTQLASLYTRNNRHERAIEIWNGLIDADPENTKFQDGLVDSLQDAGKEEEALQITLKYIEAEPDIGVHHIRLAKLYTNNNRIDDAIATYEKAIELAPGDRQIYLQMAQLYFLKDDMDNVEKAYRNAIQTTPSEYDRQNTERQIIALYRLQGNLEEKMQKAEEEGTITFEMQKLWAETLSNKGELQKSIDAYKKAKNMTVNTYEQSDISERMINLQVKLGDTDKVLETYENESSTDTSVRSIMHRPVGVSVESDADSSRVTLINAFKDKNILDELKTRYESKLEKKPDDVLALSVLANIYWDEEDYKKAGETYQKLSKSQSDNIFNFYYAAVAFKKDKQAELFKEIIKKAESAIETSSNSHDMYYLAGLGTFCYENKLYEPAIKLTKLAIEESRRYGGNYMKDRLYQLLAKNYQATKQYEKAVEAYRSVPSDSNINVQSEIRNIAKEGKLFEKWIPEQLKKVEKDPENTNLRLTLAQNYEYVEKFKEAIAQYEILTSLKPDNSEWHKKLGDLYANLAIERRETGEVVEDTTLTLTGERSYVSIADSETLNNITEQLTVSAWIRPTGYPNEYTKIILKTDERGQNPHVRSFHLQLVEGGKIRTTSAPQDKSFVSISSPANTIKLNNWHHIAAVIDVKKDSFKLFIDGNEVGRSNYRGAKSIHKSQLPFRIGWLHWNDPKLNKSYVGQIDEVRIWNIPRTEEQIRTDMNKQLNGDEPGLIGYWKFDEVKEGIITDSSPNNNDAKLVADAKLEPYKRPVFETTENENKAKSTAAYNKALELNPDSYNYYDLLAKSYLKSDKNADAEKVYRQALDAPLTQSNHDSAVRAIAGLYTADNQAEKLVAILEEIRPRMQSRAVMHRFLAETYEKLKDTEKSQLAYDRWLKIREKEMNRSTSNYSLHNFAKELLDKDLYPEVALKFAKRALQSYTNVSYTYPSTVGRACIANELYDDAIKFYSYAFSATSTISATDSIWRTVLNEGEKHKDNKQYRQLLDNLIDSIPKKEFSKWANGHRMVAQFYSNNGMKELAESYVMKGGFIPEDKWIILAPFVNIDSNGHIIDYIPEETMQIDPTAKYYGRDRLISWEESKYRSLDGHYNFAEPIDESAAYFWAIAVSPEERNVTIRFDSDDHGTVWLNGKQVHKKDGSRGQRIDRHSFPVTLKQGENKFLLKVCNSTQAWGFYFRITDDVGMPFDDLTYKSADELLSATPPEPKFHLYTVLGMIEYYSKNDMQEKAMEEMLKTGLIHENQWLVLGPFDNTEGIGYNTAYIPEDATEINLNTEYDGIDGKVIWKKSTDETFNGYIDFDRNENWRVSYAWVTLTSPDERDVQFRIGSDDQSKIWLNGKEVYAFPNYRWAKVDNDTIPVTLKAGKNTILVKICNEERSWGFYFRITDADGKPMPDLKINEIQNNQ